MSATCAPSRPSSAGRPTRRRRKSCASSSCTRRRAALQPPSINSAVSALRFFFTVTLDRPDLARRLTVVPYPRRIPTVLSVEEVTLLLQAASAPKYKAAFATAYGAGLRVSEVVALKVGDIDSERMLLRVERGKGGKDRHAMLSPQLLELLRAWWRRAAAQPVLPGGWLFPGGRRQPPAFMGVRGPGPDQWACSKHSGTELVVPAPLTPSPWHADAVGKGRFHPITWNCWRWR